MKKCIFLNNLFRFSQLFLICLFLSCENENISYSCDKGINMWVKENLRTIRTIDNSTFLSLKTDYQKAVYQALTVEQRKKIWIDKFKETLNLDWSEREIKHLKDLISACNACSDIFDKEGIEDKKDEFRIWAYKWSNEAIEQLGWTPKLLRNLLVIPDRILNKNGDIKVSDSNKFRNTNMSNNEPCNCSNKDHPQGEGLFWKDCSEVSVCITGLYNCKDFPTTLGCGLFMGDECTGRCW